MGIASDLTALKTASDTLTSNKVSRFCYTESAYADDDADGVSVYNVNNAQNIPVNTPSVLKVNQTIVDKGYRAQASSITRMLINHFFGRVSYNLNKVNDWFNTLLANLSASLGTANGIATLDANGYIPKTQLPDNSLIDFFLPVGHIIWTSDSTFDPNTKYTGTTWVQIKDKFIWAKGDSDTVDDTGGSKTHTIVANELPAHTHVLGGSTGNQSANPSFSGSHSHSHTVAYTTTGQPRDFHVNAKYISEGTGAQTSVSDFNMQSASTDYNIVMNEATVTISGTTTGDHTHSLPANTGNNSTTGNAMDIMPPYIVKYCWERTA